MEKAMQRITIHDKRDQQWSENRIEIIEVIKCY